MTMKKNVIIINTARGGIINLILFLTLHFQLIRIMLLTSLKNKTFILVIPCLFMSLFDVTMDGVQFPLIYYFFIGYFINKKRLKSDLG